jgi:class 3 adenylate cyclase
VAACIDHASCDCLSAREAEQAQSTPPQRERVGPVSCGVGAGDADFRRERPETRYARSGDYSIAYQLFGEPDLPLVYLPGFVSHVELIWEEPLAARFLEHLASFSRVLMFDKRGTGLSDRVPVGALPTLEERMDDLRAVMDDAAVGRAAVFAASEGGPMAVLFAATYPERVSALVLWSTYPCWDFPEGSTPAHEFEALPKAVRRAWETGDFNVGPDMADLMPAEQERVRRWRSRYQRSAVSPGAAESLQRMAMDMDVRDILPVIRVPTLCLTRDGDENVEPTRYMAESIPGAKYVELPGRSHIVYLGDHESAVGEIQEFLTGVRTAPTFDTVLATVLFTDIVGSTAKVAELGDRRWADLVQSHHAAVRRELDRFSGHEIDTAGDGFFAAFDGPIRAIRCATAIHESVGTLGLTVRVGVHTGECEVVDGKFAGIAVNVGARVAGQASPGEVLVTSTVRDLVAGSGLQFQERGVAELKGVPGEWRLYAVDRSS